MPYNPAVGYVPPNFRPDTGLMALLMSAQERRRENKRENERLEAMLGGGGVDQGGYNPAMGDAWGAPEGGGSPGVVGTEGTGEGERSMPAQGQEEILKQQAKLSDALSTINEIQHGVNPYKLKTMSLGQKQGLADRLRLEQVLQEQKLRHMETQARIEEALAGRELQRAQFANVLANKQALTRFGQMYSQEPPSVLRPDILAQRQTPEGRAQFALQQVPEAAAAPGADSLLNALTNLGVTGPGGGIEFSQDPVTGERFATRGRAMLPSGSDPNAPIIVQQVPTAAGEQATVLSTGRGAPTVLNRGQGATIKVVIDRDVITGQPSATWEGTAEQYRQQFGKELQPGTQNQSPPPPPPKPGAAGKLQPGDKAQADYGKEGIWEGVIGPDGKFQPQRRIR